MLSGDVEIKHCNTKDQYANFLIENIPWPKHELCKLKLGVTSTEGEQWIAKLSTTWGVEKCMYNFDSIIYTCISKTSNVLVPVYWLGSTPQGSKTM